MVLPAAVWVGVVCAEERCQSAKHDERNKVCSRGQHLTQSQHRLQSLPNRPWSSSVQRNSQHNQSPHHSSKSLGYYTMIGFIDAAFAYLAPSVGLSKDQLKFLIVLYVAVPLCAITKRLPENKPHLKNIFNIAYRRLTLVSVELAN